VHCDLHRRLTPGGDSVECEATMLPFRDGAFDVAYLIAVIHHMPPEVASIALRNARRVAKRVVITTWAVAKGRQVGPKLWVVPWGKKALRYYFHYTHYDLAKMLPTMPLAMGILKRGNQINYFVLL